MFDYFVKPFKRTKPVPIDAHFIVSDLAGVDTYIPRVLRFEGMVFYSLNEKLYYHIDQNLNPVPFGGGGGMAIQQPTLISWNVRDSNNYLDYTNLYTVLMTFTTGSIVRVEPLGVDFLVEEGQNVQEKIVRMSPVTPEIHFELYDVGPSKGVEIESLLLWSELPENADMFVDLIMEDGNLENNNSGKVFRITDGNITDYIPEITDVNTYYKGRFYKNGNNLYLCNGNSNGSDSLILIGGGGSGNCGVILWPDTELLVSDCVTNPYIDLKDDTKNILSTQTIGRRVYEVYGVLTQDDAVDLVKHDFINITPSNQNSSIIVQSRYNVTMDLIGIYHE